MKTTLAIVALAMGADLLTFSLVLPSVGIGAESNPVMVRAYVGIGLVAVVILKALVTFAIVLLVLRCRRPGFRRFAAGISVGFGALGTLGNITAGLR